jgi:hypothetical protein
MATKRTNEPVEVTTLQRDEAKRRNIPTTEPPCEFLDDLRLSIS